MPRPQRKEINFSKESILSLMQEIYNELVEQRNTAIRIQNKMLAMLKDHEDMTTIGPVIDKQQKIVVQNYQETKITKIHSRVCARELFGISNLRFHFCNTLPCVLHLSIDIRSSVFIQLPTYGQTF